MCPKANKMQLRANIMSILNYYSLNDGMVDDERFNDDVDKLKCVEDKDFLAQILFKELLSDSRDYAGICANIALLVLSSEIFQKYGIKILENKNIPDSKKFYFISLLEHKGVNIDYENLDFYIENPAEVTNGGIREFLNEALINPEARIELLDFFNNISNEERQCLLDNLLNEYNGDILYNALNILLYSNLASGECEIIFNELLKSDTYYTYSAINTILQSYELNTSMKLKASTYLENNKLKYSKKSDSILLGNSVPHVCFISFIDGTSDFSLIFTRKYQNGNLSVFFLTINLNLGITSCVGFYKINEDYFNKMIRRLFTDSLPAKISYFDLKEIMEYFACKNKKDGRELPYEYNIWKELTGDIKYDKKDIYKYLTSKLSESDINKIKFEKILKSKLIENWYFEKGQNGLTDDIFYEINLRRIKDINEVDDLIRKYTESCFAEKKPIVTEIKQRLIVQSYVSLVAGFNVSSSVLYGISKSRKYLKELILFLIYRSLYVYINNLIVNTEKNIFKKEEKTIFTKRELNRLKEAIECKFSRVEENGN